jgi:MYXO-CTERM domain-containing protein
MGGKVFAYGADATVRPGFPVEMDFSHITAAPLDHMNDLDFGVFGSVAAGDLDGDGDLEILVPGMDQYVYAWHHDGSAVAGWPVLCQFVGSSAGLQGDRIVSTPAIGDLDGDGFAEVVVGSNESINTSYSPLYAIHHDGNNHAGGPYLDGFPVTMPGFYSETLPFVGEGSPVSPALSDLDGDGDLEIMSSGMTDWGSIYDHHGEQIQILGHFDDQFGAWSNARDDTTVCFVHSPSFADLDGDGIDEVVNGGIGIGYITSMAKDYEQVQFDHFVNAWDVSDGLMKRGFPQQVEGLQFFMNPAVADLDHDGLPEVIEGTGEFLLHAFNVDGEAPEGWPKFTGQWLMGSPAVGDLDGDGYLEVVTTTRSGKIYAWHTGGHADTDVQWQSFHHDPLNSGNTSTPLPQQAGPGDGGGDDDDGCKCAVADDRAGGLVGVALAVLVLIRRRRIH